MHQLHGQERLVIKFSSTLKIPTEKKNVTYSKKNLDIFVDLELLEIYFKVKSCLSVENACYLKI